MDQPFPAESAISSIADMEQVTVRWMRLRLKIPHDLTVPEYYTSEYIIFLGSWRIFSIRRI